MHGQQNIKKKTSHMFRPYHTNWKWRCKM